MYLPVGILPSEFFTGMSNISIAPVTLLSLVGKSLMGLAELGENSTSPLLLNTKSPT